MLNLFKQPGRPWPVRIVADALEGAAKPVGGDSDATIRLVKDTSVDDAPRPRQRRTRNRARR